MIQIPLKHGKTLLIDEIDIPLVNRYKWYVRNEKTPAGLDRWVVTANVTLPSGKRSSIRLHNLILRPAPGQEVDHVDGNPLNNARDNLRFCTRAQNNWNHRKRTDNTCGFIGVQLRTRGKRPRWEAWVRVEGRSHYLGTYADPTEAAKARDEGARKFHGEFARLNFPDGG